MTLRDIGLWAMSARADAALARETAVRGVGEAFEALYRANPDPFGAVDPRYRYQARKYATLLSFLPARRFRQVLDLGCGNGAFCRALAPYADAVTGVDVSEAAVQHAASLSRAHSNLAFRTGDVSRFDADERQYDLIVIADVLYYALPNGAEAALATIARRVAAATAPGGLLLLADHYFFGFDGASRRTHAIHNLFERSTGFDLHGQHRRCFYLATLLQKAG